MSSQGSQTLVSAMNMASMGAYSAYQTPVEAFYSPASTPTVVVSSLRHLSLPSFHSDNFYAQYSFSEILHTCRLSVNLSKGNLSTCIHSSIWMNQHKLKDLRHRLLGFTVWIIVSRHFTSVESYWLVKLLLELQLTTCENRDLHRNHRTFNDLSNLWCIELTHFILYHHNNK